MTSHLLLGSPTLRELSTIEIEPQMIAGSRIVLSGQPARRSTTRARTFVIDDAKSFFAIGARSST